MHQMAQDTTLTNLDISQIKAVNKCLSDEPQMGGELCREVPGIQGRLSNKILLLSDVNFYWYFSISIFLVQFQPPNQGVISSV